VIRPRLLARVHAALFGYFWLPCPLCGRCSSGAEWKDRKGRPSSIPDPSRGPGSGLGICPTCTLAGLGGYPGTTYISKYGSFTTRAIREGLGL
jgi:hypothetical protein